ncbi:ElyC/SanA/YdcF family protein [Enterobacter ludwigii]|uniref:ElyC/SanA/YdcF family protein n=1 Tax=Enterobacter ludwigii TaxID=299767 RepID=UPI0039765131
MKKNIPITALFLAAIGMMFSHNAICEENVQIRSFNVESATENRNSVHELLLEANKAYVDWNMPLLQSKLKDAAQLAPWRTDILFSLAGSQVWAGQLKTACKTYNQILKQSPNDIDALTYLATYRLSEKDNRELQTLEKINPERANDIKHIFSVVQNVLLIPITDILPINYKNKNNVAIITLGYELKDNGDMEDTLISRLEKTLQVANELPSAKIIVSGGVPKNNKNEGIEMKRWLIDKGIDASRIIDENYARDTVENMIYSRYIVDSLKIKDVILISSGTHVRRGRAVFEILTWANGNPVNVQMVASLDKPLSQLQNEGERTFGIYRDSLRAYGLYMMRSAPELLEL